MSDPPDLERFIAAQEGTYPGALAEIGRGAKRGHWMWYVFPQIAGLGRSETARFYAIRSLDEAHAYLAHPVLGPRLRACVEALQDIAGPSADDIFGQVDAMKLRSSLTLFTRPAAERSSRRRWRAGSAPRTRARWRSWPTPATEAERA